MSYTYVVHYRYCGEKQTFEAESHKQACNQARILQHTQGVTDCTIKPFRGS